MRVFLVGSPEDRARLRAHVNGSLRIVGEFPTLAAARSSDVPTDAVLVSASNDKETDVALEEGLTPRETQVLELLAEGLPNRAIAERLAISDQTVKFHVASIFGKLAALNRTDAVRRAVRRGLISL